MARMSLIACILIATLLVIAVNSHAAPIHYAVTGYAQTHDGTSLSITGSMVIDSQIRSWYDLSPVDIQAPVLAGHYAYLIESFSLSVGPYSKSGSSGNLWIEFFAGWPDYDYFEVGDFMWFLDGDDTSTWKSWIGELFYPYNSDMSPLEHTDFYFSLCDIIHLTQSSYLYDDPILPETGVIEMWLFKQNHPVSVPEPATALLLGSGLAGLALYRRKMKKL